MKIITWSLWLSLSFVHLLTYAAIRLVHRSLTDLSSKPLPMVTEWAADFRWIFLALPLIWGVILLGCSKKPASVWHYLLSARLVTGVPITAWSLLALVVPWLPIRVCLR